MKKKMNHFIVYTLFSSIFWLFLDLVTKKWAIGNTDVVKVFGDFFKLIPHQLNDGIAFSIPVPSLIQIVGSILIIGLLFVYGLQEIMKMKGFQRLSVFLLGAVIGGGLGNLYERIFNGGGVVDFIVLGPIPVFNVADVGITVGLGLLFATMLIETKLNKKS